jgi:hypothetical protein
MKNTLASFGTVLVHFAVVFLASCEQKTETVTPSKQDTHMAEEHGPKSEESTPNSNP